ncbi:MAG: hypothetical protein A2V66_18190 [Ignavibacteria bacterium RBG_13_36_8]|nr:MAG: hypothetical protein A2V66_18190 [Ignavibacteria bacterium RBG_13_36_8]
MKGCKRNPFSAFFFILTLFSNLLLAQTNSSQIDFFSPQNRLKFGDYLFREQDYLRAINEYQEYLKIANNDTARFKFAFALAEMGRETEALDNYKGLFFSSPLNEGARLEFYKINFQQGDFVRFRDLCTEKIYLPENSDLIIQKLNRFSYLLDDNLLPDSAAFVDVFDQGEKEQVLNFYMRKKFPPYKSPLTAAVLSAIIPGAGKIYTGNYGDGITAFLLTGILSFLAYDNFKADHDFRGWLFTGLAVMFYSGNVYGSVASTQIYNVGIKFHFENEVKIYLNEKKYFLNKYDFLNR